tara:strand:- start:208 stop:486 length:279 start_codon:yes stop_codon:yes gene_type:complete
LKKKWAKLNIFAPYIVALQYNIINIITFLIFMEEKVLEKVNRLANNIGRRIILPWHLGTRRGSRGPKTLFKYIAFYWTLWWTSILSLFGFIV